MIGASAPAGRGERNDYLHPSISFLPDVGPSLSHCWRWPSCWDAYLYFALKVELGLLARRGVTRAELDGRWTELVAEIGDLTRPAGGALSRGRASNWAPQAVNLNRRGQILRLHGKGRTTAETPPICRFRKAKWSCS